MPELPEVQTVVSTLAPRVINARIQRVDLRRPDIVEPRDINLPKLLTGRTVTSLTRRGKRIVFTLDNSNRFFIHLGMSGRLTLENPDAPLKPHTHLILKLSTHHSAPSTEIRLVDPRRFGGIFWLGHESADGTMGPEPLDITTTDLASRLRKTKRPIKNALMDQRVIAGLGNIYVDESLFEAGIHPLTLSHRLKLDQIDRLNTAIKTVLRRAIEHRGSTLRDYRDAEGKSGNFQNLHRIYARDGKPCLTCGTTIKRIVLGGRSTCFCPNCQPRRQKKT